MTGGGDKISQQGPVSGKMGGPKISQQGPVSGKICDALGPQIFISDISPEVITQFFFFSTRKYLYLAQFFESVLTLFFLIGNWKLLCHS